MGYHLSHIPKGVYGHLSKIEEEVAELKDAAAQNNRVMIAVELADLVGAIEGYLERTFGSKINLSDLVKMSEATRRAWRAGDRKES
jgi:phosphoribosyl-ATP pyrophosphohydrolase